MNYFILIFLLFVSVALTGCKHKYIASLPESDSILTGRTEILFDDGWLFYRSDAPGSEKPELMIKVGEELIFRTTGVLKIFRGLTLPSIQQQLAALTPDISEVRQAGTVNLFMFHRH